MSLEGAKFICLDEAGNHGEIVLAKGRKFTMGYYVSCDLVLVDERAKGVHCEIECDAFGRVTIRNLSPDKPILVNGSSVEIKRILLNNSKLSILDKEYLWQFQKSSSNEFEDLPTEATSTPQKTTGIPEQPPNSCPDFKLHRDLPKRFTVHNFAYCIQSDEEGNISLESNDANCNENTEKNQIQNKSEEMNQSKEVLTKDSSENTSQIIGLKEKTVNRNRSITPEPNNEMIKSTVELSETPKLNLIDCIKDKENRSTQKNNNQLLTMCKQSDLVITSFSPRETGVKIEKSFAAIVKPKVLVTKPPSTPKSVYSTPKSDMYENDHDDDIERELITFHTPSTSTKAPTGWLTPSAKPLKNSSMHLIDLTTPHKLRPTSPYLKSALKASAKKNVTRTIAIPDIKVTSEEQLGLSALPATPIITDTTSGPSETPSSVISVDCSTDVSSIIELTSDGSNMGITPSSATGLNTPFKAQLSTGAATPKRTPQSLIKRAILTSAKKQNTTTQIITKNPITPCRDSLNRIPLRHNAALLKTPVTPQALTGNLSVSQLSRRQSMSTPTRKGVSTSRLFDNSASSSKLVTATPSSSSKIARTLPTSTPMSGSSSTYGQRTRAACKTSPLHKVRKSVGGVPLSSHISKARNSMLVSASASKITSIKEKSPQQVMSDRLVANARKSLCVTPNLTKSRNTATTAKTTPSQKPCPSSILKDKIAQSARKPERKVLFADKQPVDTREEDNLSRTFIVDSDEENNTEIKKQKERRKDGTFSPKKDSNEIELGKTTVKQEKEQQSIETPLDVEEVSDLTKVNEESKCENKNQTTKEDKKSIVEECDMIAASESHVDNKENNAPTPDSDRIKSIVTEESFAEVVNDSKEQNINADTFEISNNPIESSRTESQESFAETVEDIAVVESRKEVSEDLAKPSNQVNNNKADVAGTGFGEESIEEIGQTTHNENVLYKEEISNLSELQQETQAINVSDAMEVKTNTPIKETKSLDVQEFNNKVDPKGDEQKSYEYKPIVEDITLEESVIEKETKENEKLNVSKQPSLCEDDITLEGSLIEEKVKSEEIKEENNRQVIEESKDNKQPSSPIANVCETTEPIENLQQPNILQANKISTNINQEKDIKLFDKIGNEEKPKNNQNEVELLETNLDDKNIEVNTENSEIKQQLQDCQSQPSEAYNVTAQAPNENEAKTVKRTEDFKSSKSENQDPTTVESILDTDDAEDTNKLLEEIEDVLNKSDEIKQKQLTETEKENETILMEEFESEKCSQENSETVLTNESEELTSNDEELGETSIPGSPAQTIRLSKQEDKNESTATSQESGVEIYADNIAKTCDSTEESSKIETLTGNEERSEYKKQLEDNGENTHHASLQEQSKAKEPISVKQNEKKDEQDTQEIIVFQTENNASNKVVNDSCDQKNVETTITHEEIKEENVQDVQDVPTQSKNKETLSTQKKSEEQVIQCDEPLKGIEVLSENKDAQSFANINTKSKSNETDIDTEKGSDLNKTETLQNLEGNEELKTIRRKIEKDVIFTPRRSKRRASQSSDTPQASEELSFTPRRSTRRASLSTEPTTCTPTNKTTRRSSLSVVNETTLTPKSNIKRRSSISIEQETPKPSTSKIQKAKTPRKQLEEHMVIPEEIDEVLDAITKGDEEVPAAEEIQLEEKNRRISIAYHDETLNPSAIQIMITQDETDKVVEVRLEEEIEPETEQLVKNESENRILAGETLTTDSYINTEKQQDDIENILETEVATEEDTKTTDENQKVVAAVETSDNQVANDSLVSEQKPVISDEIVTKVEDLISEEEQIAEQEIIETLAEHVASNTNSDDIEDIIAQDLDVTSDNPEDNLLTAFNTSSVKQHEADEIISEDENPSLTKSEEEHQIIAENASESHKDSEIFRLSEISKSPETSTHDETKEVPETCAAKMEKSSEILDDSLRTPSTSSGLSDLACTDGLESTTEKLENVALVADLARIPETHMLGISTPKAKKQVKIVAESPKTPVMTGMRELLKTPKAEPRTPRLGGIRDLVRTPREGLENEEEECEKLAVVAELIKTPVTNVSEISTPKAKKHVTIAAESPKTPLMAGMRELLKTPKAEPRTPRLGGIRDLMRTPREGLENEEEDCEKLAVVAELIKTPVIKVSEISTPKAKKHVTIVADSPKTPLMAGMRELLKTPKAEPRTPRLGGIRDLVRTPREGLENEQEECEKLAVVAELVATPQEIPVINIIEEIPSTSMNSDNLKGVKELLKTPTSCRTPRFKGIRELMKTPKTLLTPITSGVKELLESPVLQESRDLQTSNVEVIENTQMTKNPVSMQSLEQISSTDAVEELEEDINIVKEQPKTPKSYRMPRELTQAPKMSSTPFLSGIKDFMGSPAQQNDLELEQYLRTPRAKNIMIPSMPSSAVIEKSSDSIEISTEYDLNATHDGEAPNLEELFKTPVAERFVDRITGSYYGQEEFEQDDETDDEFNKTNDGTLQDTLNKSAEEAFDKLVGQESQIQTPIRKTFSRKSFTLQTPLSQSPFTAADVLSDLPKTDVEEWIETLGEAEPPPSIILECDNSVEEDENVVEQDINESAKDIEELSDLELCLSEQQNKQQHHSFDDSIIPETCCKVYLTENTHTNKTTAPLTYHAETKDPLSSTITKLIKEKETSSLDTPIDAEMSGIDLLDQTVESVQDEPSMLDEPLVVEPSMFEEHLMVSDNESEAENTLEMLQDDGNDLSEPLLLSDSEDLNVSQEATTKNKYEIKQELQTSNLDIAIQEKSLLEKLPADLLAEDPLGTEAGETSGIMIKDENISLVEIVEKSTTLDLLANENQKSFIETELPTEPKEEKERTPEDCLTNDLNTIDKEFESAEQEIPEVLEVSSTSQLTSTTQIDKTEIQSANLLIENIDGEIDAAETHVENKNTKEIAIEETKVISSESENIFLDSSVTELCEETSTINEEHVESKEKDESKKDTKEKADIECQNIFMDNSNIDESFADEAANKDNEASVSEATTKTITKNDSLSLSLSEEAYNDIEIVVSETEEVEIIKENETKAQHSDTNKVEILEETHELIQTTGEQCELTELPSLVETKETSVIKAVACDEKQIETNLREEETSVNDIENTEIKPSETLITKLEAIDEKQVETISSETTVLQLETLDTVKETLDTDTVKPKTPTKDITQDTALPTTENFITKEDLEHSNSLVVEKETKDCVTPDFSDSPQSTTAGAMNKKNMISHNEITIPAESIDKATHGSPIDSSTAEVKVENYKPSEAVLNETSGSTEVKISDTCVSQKDEEYSETIDKINEDKTETEENSKATDENAQALQETENIVCETSNELAENYEIGKLMESPSKEVSSSSKAVSLTEDLAESTLKDVKPLENAAKNLRETSEVVKYDIEVKIIDTDYTKEKDFSSSKEPIMEIPEYTKDSKPLDDKTLHSPKHEKAVMENLETAREMGQEVKKVIAEESEINDVAPAARTVRKKRTASESSQESTQGEETNRTSRRDRRKIIKKPIEQKPIEEAEEIIDNQQISNDIIPENIKKDEKLKRKQRTLSDSSQGSAKDDECNATTRRGGRRKVQKSPIEATVLEQRKEEEFIPQAAVREEQKAKAEEEANKPIILTEKTCEKNQDTQNETATESNQQITLTNETTDKQESTLKETVMETRNEAEKVPVEELIEETKVVNENQEKQSVKTEELKKLEEFTTSKDLYTDEQKSGSRLKEDVAESGSKIETKDHLSAIQDQVLSREEHDSSVSIEETKTNEVTTGKQEQVEQEGILNVSAAVEELLNIPQGSLTTVPVEDTIKEEDTTSKEDTVEQEVEKLDEVKQPEEELCGFSNKKDSTSSKQLKRGRCKQTASESSQGYSQEDDNKHTKRSQRKVQKTSGEEDAVDKSLDDEEKKATATKVNEIEEISLKTEISHVIEQPIDLAEDQIVKHQSTTSEVQEEAQNLGRRKATVSESSQGSAHEDNIPRIRRVRRKVQKTPIEEIVIEEKTSELQVSAETEENNVVPSKLSATEEVSNDNVKNKTKTDADIIEVSTVESKESMQDHKPTSKENHTLEPIEVAIIEDKTPEVSKDHDKKSKEITHKRGRNKHVPEEHVLEEPTTSRRGRRKVQVSTAEGTNIEAKVQIESEIEASQVECIKVKEVEIVTTVEENQAVQDIVAPSKEEMEMEKQETETQTITKHSGRRGRHYKAEVKESVIEEAANEEDTISKSSEIRNSENVTVKEICATINEELQNETPESAEVVSTQEETDKETLEVEHSTKKSVKRGRRRKVEVEEDKKLEEKDELTPLHATRRGGRHKTTASETTTTALTKGRSTNRNRKTPIEHSKLSAQQESPEVNEKPIEIADNTPTVVVTTAVEVTEVRSRSKNRKTPVDQPTASAPQEQPTQDEKEIEAKQIKEISTDSEMTNKLSVVSEGTKESLENVSKENEFSADEKLVEETKKSVKNSIKRTRTGFEVGQGDEKPTKKRTRRQIDEIEESHDEDVVLIDTKIISTQIQQNESTEDHAEEVEIAKDNAAKLQKPTRRRAAAIPEIKSKRRRGVGHEESETQCLESEKPTEDILMSEVKITEVNLEPEESLDQHASAEEVNQQTEVVVKKGRKKAAIEENRKEDHEALPATKRKGVVKHDHDESASATKKRVGRKKHVETHEEDTETEVDVVATTSKRRNIGRKKEEGQKDDHHHSVMDKEEQIHSESKKKAQHETEDQDKHSLESSEKVKEPTNIENSGDAAHSRSVRRKQLDLGKDHDHDSNVCGENLHEQEETKKGRGRRQKTNQQEKYEVTTASQSPETKHRGGRSKQSHTDTPDDTTKEEEDQSDKTTLKVPSANTESQTPQPTAPVAKKGRKPIKHITAESQEVEDTPGRKAREVPLRRAATAYHNYDETSDSEILTKTKKKTDSPRKSLEAVKTSPTATITSAPIMNLSPSTSSSTTPATTARGRTRKPTAKVQQFLEKERAKAETPKKRGLLAAAAGSDGAATPQHTPARRGRKPSTIETEVAVTPQVSKSRGRGRPAASHTKEDANVVPETTAVVEEKEIEVQTTPPPSNTIKGRRGGRKAKIIEEEPNNSDEPPAKKSSQELESEKQHSSTSVEIPTPTRVAGRRNAAAAAKARIEEDALAAAAIEPPKRARAKKAATKLSSLIPAITVTDVHSSEAEEEQTPKDEKVDKNKNSSQLREHRLASASTIDGVDDLEDVIEKETTDKPANKRGRKPAATAALTATNSPAVPAKKGRKAKNLDEVADMPIANTPVEPTTSRGRGRGRKNFHLNENETEASSTSQQNTNDNTSAPVVETTEPAKKITRTRRK